MTNEQHCIEVIRMILQDIDTEHARTKIYETGKRLALLRLTKFHRVY